MSDLKTFKVLGRKPTSRPNPADGQARQFAGPVSGWLTIHPVPKTLRGSAVRSLLVGC
jgi:hypothetical protein